MAQQRPPNVISPAPALVLPRTLCSRFESSSGFMTLVNEYPSADSQRRAVTTREVRRWRVARRLTAAEWTAFFLFYEQVKDGRSFYFYDPWETAPRFHCDPTGIAENGRYRVRFASALTMTAGQPRVEADFELIEVS